MGAEPGSNPAKRWTTTYSVMEIRLSIVGKCESSEWGPWTGLIKPCKWTTVKMSPISWLSFVLKWVIVLLLIFRLRLEITFLFLYVININVMMEIMDFLYRNHKSWRVQFSPWAPWRKWHFESIRELRNSHSTSKERGTRKRCQDGSVTEKIENGWWE